MVLLHKVENCTRVDVTTTSAHHKTFGGSQSHCGVDAFAVVNGCYATTITHVATYHLTIKVVNTEEVAHAFRHVSVAGAMKSVSTNVVDDVVFIWQCVHICLGGHCLVESGVEDSHLRHVGQDSCDGINTRHVNRVVQRCYAIALLNHGDNFVVDKHAFVKLFATMHHAVPYRIDFLETGDTSIFSACKISEDSLDSAGVVADVEVDLVFCSVLSFKLYKGVGQADFLYATFSQHVISFNLDEFVFNGTTSAVEH